MSEFYEGLAEILEVDVDQVKPELSLEERAALTAMYEAIGLYGAE